MQIGFYLDIGQIAELDTDLRQPGLGKATVLANHRHGSLENDGFAAHGLQLRRGPCVVARFAQCPAFKIGNLVRADDDGIRVQMGH
ncbi:hypothetical protein GALL_400310 [mine drainage metagenome]|uniref:Uncharacterized protein n=1 Tax=mine drainage metagenome TaxID=410659 RepID=A0A1J5QE33_9ZZZZ